MLIVLQNRGNEETIVTKHERKIFESLTEQLTRLMDGESCDHSVNICWCAEFATLEEAHQILEGRKSYIPKERRAP